MREDRRLAVSQAAEGKLEQQVVVRIDDRYVGAGQERYSAVLADISSSDAWLDRLQANPGHIPAVWTVPSVLTKYRSVLQNTALGEQGWTGGIGLRRDGA